MSVILSQPHCALSIGVLLGIMNLPVTSPSQTYGEAPPGRVRQLVLRVRGSS
jgi:hypothetical protein